MTETDPLEPGPSNDPAQSQGDPRKPRGIPFSDSELEEVKAAAQSLDVPAAEFVRDRIWRSRAAVPAPNPPQFRPLWHR